jgi:hypothetical protein
MNFYVKKLITGWEKAIYYFSTINTTYKHMWFFEDDVFFHNEDVLLNIDSKYIDSDLLSAPYQAKNNRSWHWDKITIKFPEPYYNAMVCSVRMSSMLLSYIKDYTKNHNTLFFLEALFPTICKKYTLKYDTPAEFNNITFNNTINRIDINKTNLYHPVKDIQKHIYYRNMILKN